MQLVFSWKTDIARFNWLSILHVAVSTALGIKDRKLFRPNPATELIEASAGWYRVGESNDFQLS